MSSILRWWLRTMCRGSRVRNLEDFGSRPCKPSSFPRQSRLLMWAFLVRRVIFALVLVACSSSAAFLLTRFAPGDVTAQLGAFPTAEEVAAIRARFGLDRSVVEQWMYWVARAIRLDFGESFLYSRPVTQLLGPAALNTAVLALAALGGAIAVGLALGIVS